MPLMELVLERKIEMENKHLSYDERLIIEKGINNNESFKKIANKLEKNCTTIAREIKNHYVVENTGSYGRRFNDCVFRTNCPNRNNCELQKCSQYQKEECQLLSKPPYVCNGCKNRTTCTLTKHLYKAEYAQKEYSQILKESRSGITYTDEELSYIDSILYPLVTKQNQSIHHAYINNISKMICSEKEIYRLVDSGLLKIRNIDLPRKVRRKIRRKSERHFKIDKKCRIGRTYQDFLKYIEKHPDTAIVEMDSVEGIKGGKVLLTIHFKNTSFMLSFIRDANTAQSVIDLFNEIQDKIGLENFKKLFPIILTDNGTEFSDPKKIEYDQDGNQRTKIFYCDPSSPEEKGSCEVNHEMIRRIFEKGESFNEYNQEQISLMMSHINSYSRAKLNDKKPIEIFNLVYGEEISKSLGIIEISSNDVTLTKKIFKNS